MKNGWEHKVKFNQTGPSFGIVSILYIDDHRILSCAQFWNETSEEYYNRLIKNQNEGHCFNLPEGGEWLAPKKLLK